MYYVTKVLGDKVYILDTDDGVTEAISKRQCLDISKKKPIQGVQGSDIVALSMIPYVKYWLKNFEVAQGLRCIPINGIIFLTKSNYVKKISQDTWQGSDNKTYTDKQLEMLVDWDTIREVRF